MLKKPAATLADTNYRGGALLPAQGDGENLDSSWCSGRKGPASAKRFSVVFLGLLHESTEKHAPLTRGATVNFSIVTAACQTPRPRAYPRLAQRVSAGGRRGARSSARNLHILAGARENAPEVKESGAAGRRSSSPPPRKGSAAAVSALRTGSLRRSSTEGGAPKARSSSWKGGLGQRSARAHKKGRGSATPSPAWRKDHSPAARRSGPSARPASCGSRRRASRCRPGRTRCRTCCSPARRCPRR